MKIEKNIPIPSKEDYVKNHYQTHGFYAKISELFKEMQIGDSISMPLICRSGSRNIALRAKIKIKVKKDGENIRVWRIA